MSVPAGQRTSSTHFSHMQRPCPPPLRPCTPLAPPAQVFIRPNKVVYLPTTFMEENFDPESLPINCEMVRARRRWRWYCMVHAPGA